MKRILKALLYSKDGLKVAFVEEAAFRQVVVLGVLSTMGAVFCARSFMEFVVLFFPGVLCVIVELLNSALENAVDFAGTQEHPLAKKAKDMGSAAQLISLGLLVLVWGGYFIF